MKSLQLIFLLCLFPLPGGSYVACSPKAVCPDTGDTAYYTGTKKPHGKCWYGEYKDIHKPRNTVHKFWVKCGCD